MHERERRDVVDLALAMADEDAKHGQFDDALLWLDIAEVQLTAGLPAVWTEKRARWLADGGGHGDGRRQLELAARAHD